MLLKCLLFFVLMVLPVVALASPSNSILSGTYGISRVVSGFNSGTETMALAGRGSITFNGSGGCNSYLIDTEYALNLASGSIADYSGTNDLGCSYNVDSSGGVTLTFTGDTISYKGSVSGDGTSFSLAGPDSDVKKKVMMITGHKLGTGMGLSSLSGTYGISRVVSGFNSGTETMALAGRGSITFNGSGGCNSSLIDTEYALNLASGSIADYSGTNDLGCSYNVDSSGGVTLTFTGDTISYKGSVSGDGTSFSLAGPDSDVKKKVMMITGHKLGTGMGLSSLSGTYGISRVVSGFNSGTETMALAGRGSITFNGSGGCNSSLIDTEYALNLASGSIADYSGTNDLGCSYNVDSSGGVTLTFTDDTISYKGSVSGNGTSFSLAGPDSDVKKKVMMLTGHRKLATPPVVTAFYPTPYAGPFTASPTADTCGEWGLSHINNASCSVTGNTLTMVDSEDDPFTLSRVLTSITNPLVGTWLYGDPSKPNDSGVIVFLQNGKYLQIQDGGSNPTGQDGFEVGTYSWNPDTGLFTPMSITLDTNGEWGFSSLSHATMAVDGNSLTISNIMNTNGSGDEDAIMTRIAPTPGNPLVGAWLGGGQVVPGNTVLLAFVDDSHYLFAEDGDSVANPGGQDGMERGSYTLTPTANTLTIGLTVSATDDTGVTGYYLSESSTPPSVGAQGWTAQAPTTYTFASAGTKTLYLWVKDGNGNLSAMRSTTVTVSVPLPTYTLSATIVGSGSINSITPGISFPCTSGTCANPFSSGTQLVLRALAEEPVYLFSGWSGDCTGGGDCSLTMSGNRNVTATFTQVPNAKVEGGGSYATLAGAYGAVANKGKILAQAKDFIEDLNLSRGIAFTLSGGYGSDFLSNPGWTTLKGILTIGTGGLTVEKLAIH